MLQCPLTCSDGCKPLDAGHPFGHRRQAKLWSVGRRGLGLVIINAPAERRPAQFQGRGKCFVNLMANLTHQQKSPESVSRLLAHVNERPALSSTGKNVVGQLRSSDFMPCWCCIASEPLTAGKHHQQTRRFNKCHVIVRRVSLFAPAVNDAKRAGVSKASLATAIGVLAKYVPLLPS